MIYSSYTEHVRALQTEYSLLYRLTLVVVSILTIACMLMVFENVRRVGTSLLASAGLIGIVAGIAPSILLPICSPVFSSRLPSRFCSVM